MSDTMVPPAIPTGPTPEEIAAQAAAKAAAKAAEIAARKAAKEAEAKEKAAQKAAEKAAREAQRQADRERKVAEKLAQKEAAAQAKVVNKMPEQNGVRRPKPDTICGRNWETYDQISIKNGSPCTIKEALEVLGARGVNESTIRTQYAHWRKFNGIVGRVVAPIPVPPLPPEAPPAPPTE